MSDVPRAFSRPHQQLIDPRRQLLIVGNNREKAQDMARRLLRENAQLLRVLGALLERTGPVEVDKALTDEASTVLFEVERYQSTDGMSDNWVSRRVAG